MFPKQWGTITELQTGKHFSASVIESSIALWEKRLSGTGLAKGQIVALANTNSAEFFFALLAAWRLECCVMPLAHDSPQAEREKFLQISKAAVWVDSQNVIERTQGDTVKVSSALLLYTSGSSGAPKGVLLSRRALEKKIDCLNKELAATKNILCFLPLSFGHGLIANALFSLLTGRNFIFSPYFDLSLCTKLETYLKQYQIDFMSSVPAFWRLLLAVCPKIEGHSLQRVYCASTSLMPDLHKKIVECLGPHVLFKNVYGITEAGSWIASLPDGIKNEDSACVGRAWSGQFYIDKKTAEIYFQSEFLMDAYHLDPSLTQQVLGEHGFKTGDTGFLDEAGFLHLRDRLHDLIHRGGAKVSPLEVEALLLENPSVQEAFVFGIEDELRGEKICAALATKDSLDPAQMETWCGTKMAAYKIPEAWYFFTDLPKNKRGKVDRESVRELCLKKK